MGRHPRLGCNSCVAWLPKDVAKLIASFIPRSNTIPFRMTFEKMNKAKARGKSDISMPKRKILIRAGQSILFQSSRMKLVEIENRPSTQFVQLMASFSVIYSFPRFLELPERVLLRILSFMKIEMVGKMEMTCQAMRSLILSRHVYMQFCNKGFTDQGACKQESLRKLASSRPFGFWNFDKLRNPESYCVIN